MPRHGQGCAAWRGRSTKTERPFLRRTARADSLFLLRAAFYLGPETVCPALAFAVEELVQLRAVTVATSMQHRSRRCFCGGRGGGSGRGAILAMSAWSYYDPGIHAGSHLSAPKTRSGERIVKTELETFVPHVRKEDTAPNTTGLVKHARVLRHWPGSDSSRRVSPSCFSLPARKRPTFYSSPHPAAVAPPLSRPPHPVPAIPLPAQLPSPTRPRPRECRRFVLPLFPSEARPRFPAC